MYATLRRVKIVPGSAAEIARRVEAGFVPLVSALSGFVSFALIDHGDTMATFTLFAEHEQAEQGNLRAAAWVKENLGELVAGPLEMSVGEVVVHAS
jgi:hypothetical protein